MEAKFTIRSAITYVAFIIASCLLNPGAAFTAQDTEEDNHDNKMLSWSQVDSLGGYVPMSGPEAKIRLSGTNSMFPQMVFTSGEVIIDENEFIILKLGAIPEEGLDFAPLEIHLTEHIGYRNADQYTVDVSRGGPVIQHYDMICLSVGSVVYLPEKAVSPFFGMYFVRSAGLCSAPGRIEVTENGLVVSSCLVVTARKTQ